jgi:hypothetical protein
MSPQKLLFCYHLPTRGRAGVKLGDAWYVSDVSIIFYAPCLFYTNCFVFCLHFVLFLCFFGTNLLMRCHSTNSLFSAIFVFQKSYIGNILGIGQNEAQSSYFPPTRDGVQRIVRGGPGQPHLVVAWVDPLVCHPRVWDPWLPSDIAPPPINSLRCKNPKSIGVYPSKVP